MMRYGNGFCASSKEETLGADARFQTNALRTKHRDALIPALCEIFDRPASEWLSRLIAKISQLPLSRLSAKP